MGDAPSSPYCFRPAIHPILLAPRMLGPLQMMILPYTPSAQRARGVTYVAQGRVRIVQASPRLVRAKVRGSETYEVVLTCEPGADGHEVMLTCTCPFSQENDCCKHGWALLQEVDRLGVMKPPPGARFIPLAEAPTHPHVPEMPPPAPPAIPRAAKPAAPEWKKALRQIDDATPRSPIMPVPEPERPRDLGMRFWLDLNDDHFHELVVGAAIVSRKQNGEWGKGRALGQHQALPPELPADDMTLAALLLSLADKNTYYTSGSGLVLRTRAASRVLPLLCARGDFLAHLEGQRYGPLRWDGDEPWRFELALDSDDDSADFLVRGWYCRGEMRRPLDEAIRLLRDGWVVWPDAIGRLESTTGFEWIAVLRQKKTLRVKADEAEDFVDEAMKRLNLPYLRLPSSLHIEEVRLPPAPRLNIHQSAARPGRLVPLTIAFAYGDEVVRAQPERPRLETAGPRRIVYRDLAAERAHVERAAALGVRRQHSYVEEDPQYGIEPSRLPELVRTLLAEPWMVAAENRPVRTTSTFSVSVASGIDWFDVTVQCDFGGERASLPALLAAARERRDWIELGDGTWGMVPEEWLKKYAGIAALGDADATTIRFRNNQAALLDAWLAGQPDVSIDDLFRRTRERLATASKVAPVEAPAGFRGTLRPYQKEGLGWLHYLQQMGFGGCLADDMGLGKTVQVLALLEARRTRRGKEDLPPSLIVVPRSLLFNWRQEAAKFAPQLRLLDFTGVGRAVDDAAWKDIDVILTTYGTLRRDIEQLKELEFDYVILDEAQAVKNAAALTAKSVRLLRSRHRLAMSGTPVENHLGEVWSLFEFLNPGLLGAASAFSQSIARDAAPEQRALLGRALRPFLLRRTKGQVAKDLPDRQEDTLVCEMEPAQRKQYDELRDYYRKALLEKVEADGLNRSKIVVLEALLRLRQAACHPALIDKARAGESCAKFDALLPQLAEVVEEGHKALVFSQFTGFLALLRKELDARGIVYEYLDGKTRDRQARVDRFQTDPACPLFLISLKAGGVGLNLTAAEYVFLLDPWWNPAVEAQAIDRAHRIGQTRKVMAYRLIAKDTVEEKVLALQDNKRELANAILSEDNAVLRNLTLDDLAFLLG